MTGTGSGIPTKGIGGKEISGNNGFSFPPPSNRIHILVGDPRSAVHYLGKAVAAAQRRKGQDMVDSLLGECFD